MVEAREDKIREAARSRVIEAEKQKAELLRPQDNFRGEWYKFGISGLSSVGG